MTNTQELTVHEMLELHEFLRNQNLGIKKLQSTTSIVKDQELATFIQGTVVTRREKLKEMQQFIDGNINLQ